MGSLRPFGTSGLAAPAVGLGAGPLGDPALGEAEAERLLHAALDLGATLVDTAPSYGRSEARIGRHLARRRGEFVLVTKVGYGVEGEADWTAACVAKGIDQALRRLRTDVLDVVLLHSCGPGPLADEGILAALEAARRAGKLRVAGYSGEGAPLAWAAASGRLGALECSVNLWDQGSLDGLVEGAASRGLGVIAKRPLANAPWRFAGRPAAPDLAAAWDRWRALGLDLGGLPPEEAAIRFAAHAPGVACAVLGTTREAHLRRGVEAAARGPLPPDVVRGIRAAWRARAQGWEGIV